MIYDAPDSHGVGEALYLMVTREEDGRSLGNSFKGRPTYTMTKQYESTTDTVYQRVTCPGESVKDVAGVLVWETRPADCEILIKFLEVSVAGVDVWEVAWLVSHPLVTLCHLLNHRDSPK